MKTKDLLDMIESTEDSINHLIHTNGILATEVFMNYFAKGDKKTLNFEIEKSHVCNTIHETIKTKGEYSFRIEKIDVETIFVDDEGKRIVKGETGFEIAFDRLKATNKVACLNMFKEQIIGY